MSGRLSRMFEGLDGGRAALITYATGYHPDGAGSERVIRAMLDGGADAVEIGLPFSDPVMDGPIIQETSARALEAGATPPRILDLVSALRPDTEKPLLVMTYYNPVFRYGLETFAHDAAGAGADGVIIPDLPVEEMGPWKEACSGGGPDTIAFCSITTSPERIEAAGRITTGFVYCVSLLGTTGPRDSVAPELPGFLRSVRSLVSCPIAAGVGISTPQQCAEVGLHADGVIVGSELMRLVMEGNGDLGALSEMVARMADALARV